MHLTWKNLWSAPDSLLKHAEGNMLNNMLCARAGVWTISRASALCLLKYAWPLNAINAYLGSAVPASVMKSRANVGDYTHTEKRGHSLQTWLTHTETHVFFSARGQIDTQHTTPILFAWLWCQTEAQWRREILSPLWCSDTRMHAHAQANAHKWWKPTKHKWHTCTQLWNPGYYSLWFKRPAFIPLLH